MRETPFHTDILLDSPKFCHVHILHFLTFSLKRKGCLKIKWKKKKTLWVSNEKGLGATSRKRDI